MLPVNNLIRGLNGGINVWRTTNLTEHLLNLADVKLHTASNAIGALSIVFCRGWANYRTLPNYTSSFYATHTRPTRMSTFMRILFMFVTWLIFALLTFYTCVKPECCGTGELAAATPAATVPTDLAPAAAPAAYALYSTLDTDPGEVDKGAEYQALLADLRQKYAANPDQNLEVYGNFYESEPKPAGYDNMGFKRADETKQLLLADLNIPEERIIPLARRLPDAAPAAGERFSAASFNFAPLNAGIDANTGAEASEVVTLDENNYEIRFPYDESTKNLDGDTEEYLRKVAQVLQSGGGRATVTGHTDIRGTDAYNMRLGQRRADFIRDRLVSYGAPANRITTRSQGEAQLAMRGNTAQAHRRNRRAEIQIAQ